MQSWAHSRQALETELHSHHVWAFSIEPESLSGNPSISLWTIFFKKGIFIDIQLSSQLLHVFRHMTAAFCPQTNYILTTNRKNWIRNSFFSLDEFLGLVLQNFTGHMLDTSLKKVLFPICNVNLPYVVPKVLSKCKTPMVLSEHCMEMWLFPLSQDCLSQHFLMSILPISEPISISTWDFFSHRKGRLWDEQHYTHSPSNQWLTSPRCSPSD